MRLRRGLDTSQPPSAEAFRGAAWLVSAAANNLPDLDFVYVAITGGRLGYLLHHRGHTHTLGAAPILALLTWALVAYVWKRRGRALTRDDHRWLGALALGGIALHVGMDSLNDYGVHPLWPLSGRWFHGDTIFIVEPLFWVALAGPLLWSATTRAGKLALAAPVALAVLLPFLIPALPWPAHLLVGLLALTMPALSWRLGEPTRAMLAVGATLAIIAVFAGGRAMAEANARAALAAAFPRTRVAVLALQPSPSDPRCFRGLAAGVQSERVQRDGEPLTRRTYVVRRFVVIASAALGAPSDCGMQHPLELSAPRARDRDHDTPTVDFIDAYVTPMDELDALRADCTGHAFLRFARVPFLADLDGARIAGDLRYDREPSNGFAEIELTPDAACPDFVPGWDPPAGALFER